MIVVTGVGGQRSPRFRGHERNPPDPRGRLGFRAAQDAPNPPYFSPSGRPPDFLRRRRHVEIRASTAGNGSAMAFITADIGLCAVFAAPSPRADWGGSSPARVVMESPESTARRRRAAWRSP